MFLTVDIGFLRVCREHKRAGERVRVEQEPVEEKEEPVGEKEEPVGEKEEPGCWKQERSHSRRNA